ncbi:unnamed protein product [Phytophthora fragariaefolia]|uniref:Unnamed protein product n=1 Tax=Phytophthora fragariaefolia TaxID=1490495 RepID=A0A9W6XQM5_9STRA|nr:unnamed protein product [Phytophthora fragariaefolia]
MLGGQCWHYQADQSAAEHQKASAAAVVSAEDLERPLDLQSPPETSPTVQQAVPLRVEAGHPASVFPTTTAAAPILLSTELVRSLRQVHKTGSEDGLGWVMDSSLVQTAHSRISGLASMRSGRREKPAAPVAAPHDVDFRHLWRQLKAAGWTSKQPSGIQTDWDYTSAKGAVLVGERAVVEYAFQSGLLVEEQDGEEDGGEVHVGEEGGEGKHVGETGGDEEHVG